MVDPLDGTKEFIKRNGEFTVNIALIKNGNPLLGVIYVPVSKTLYYTLEDASKSYKIELVNEKVSLDFIFKHSIEIKPSHKKSELIRIVGSRSHLNEATKKFISKIEKKMKTEIVSKGSSLKFCLVAEGIADVYPRFAPTMEWDTAAGHAVLLGAGGDVVRFDDQTPLKYGKEDFVTSVAPLWQSGSRLITMKTELSKAELESLDPHLYKLQVTPLQVPGIAQKRSLVTIRQQEL